MIHSNKLLALVASAAMAIPSADACTSLIAGKKATADGSIMITYAADSHTLYGRSPNGTPDVISARYPKLHTPTALSAI